MTYTQDQFTQDNYKFNELAGSNILVSLDDLKDQFKLIKAEVLELEEALDLNDPAETLKEMVDVYVTLDGLRMKLEYLGFDVLEGMKVVADNNLTKFVDTKLQADMTQLHFKHNKGIETIVEYNETYKKYVIKDTNGKVRKPLGFESVKLSALVPDEVKGGFKPRVTH